MYELQLFFFGLVHSFRRFLSPLDSVLTGTGSCVSSFVLARGPARNRIDGACMHINITLPEPDELNNPSNSSRDRALR